MISCTAKIIKSEEAAKHLEFFKENLPKPESLIISNFENHDMYSPVGDLEIQALKKLYENPTFSTIFQKFMDSHPNADQNLL